jgi:Mn-dependent DtxR family transcriptional regulator
MSFGATVSRIELAQVIGHQPTSGTFATYLSRLASLEIIEYPQRGMVKVTDWAKR